MLCTTDTHERDKLIKNLIILLSLTVGALSLRAQSITNVQVTQEGKTVVITYDLEGKIGEKYTISLEASKDGGKTYLLVPSSVTGDIGKLISLSYNKRIVWDVLKDVEKLVGADFVFKVKGTSESATSFTDTRDGKTYKTIKIGNQVWMAENLNYDAGNGTSCYDNKSSNCAQYGRLYTWEAAKRAAPPGWHLPSKSEFEQLLSYLGGKGNVAYEKLIQGGSSRLDVLFGGSRSISGYCRNLGSNASFWSSSKTDTVTAWYLYVASVNRKADLANYNRNWGYSIRCLKD